MAKKKAKQKPPPPALPEEILRQAMAEMGRRGGSKRGISKARSSEQARAAVNVRWAKYRAKQAKDAQGSRPIDTDGDNECPPTTSTQS